MSDDRNAMAWAKARATGPLRIPTGAAAPAGMTRLVGPDPGTVWAVPVLLESAGPRVITELGLSAPAVDKPTVAAQVLACCLRCCWPSPTDALWPGTAVSQEQVVSVFGQINRGRSADYLPRAVVPALRQLAWTGWLIYRRAPGIVRLGPRVVQWSDIDVNGLRDLWRMMPAPASVEPRP